MNNNATTFFLILSAILFMSLQPVRAQFTEPTKQQFSWGLKGGISFADHISSNVETRSRLGILVGGFVNFRLPELPLSFQPELQYIQKGTDQINSDIETDYFEIPILAKLHILSNASNDLHLIAGPYAGFVVKADEVLDNEINDVSDQTNTELGGIFGIGTQFNAGRSNLFIEARLELGFTEIFDSSDVKNSVISINTGITF